MKCGLTNTQAFWELANPQKPQASGPGKRDALQAQADVKSADQSSFRPVSKKTGVLNRCATPSVKAPGEVRQGPDFASIIKAAVKLSGSHRL